ncbi:MAG TPA: YdeI/OmpD-associated family protein [Bacteroidia bacterium]|nr:YdeI/OmpD-associated family protein [Bacteroidia bacterium]
MAVIKFTTTILRFGQQGEKTGWTYIIIPADIANKLQPGNRKGFRTKGKLDNHKFSGKSLIPLGKGEFILTLDKEIRKAIGKRHGAMLEVQIEFDKSEYKLNSEFIECLNDEPGALKFFNTLTGSHQRYFSKWIESAKTEETKAKRIAQAINTFLKKQGFPEMLRANRANR